MARARLERQDRGIGRELHVCVRDLGRVRAQHDRAVHLRQLVQERGRVVEIELDPAREQERQLLRVAERRIEQGQDRRQ